MEKKFGTRIYVHVDAAQAPLWLPCELDALGCDMLSLDAGKCYGPKGVGVLAYIHGVKIAPIVFGGSQEGGLRAGTENTALIVGAVEALAIAQKEWSARAAQVEKERDHFFTMLLSIPGCVRNGSQEKRLANNVNISILGIDSEFAVVKLDAEGISASTKSACGGAKGDGSHVVRTMSGDDSRATSTIRFTLGEDTLRQDLEKTTRILALHVETMMPFKKS
jgi:cysteine desulfurase